MRSRTTAGRDTDHAVLAALLVRTQALAADVARLHHALAALRGLLNAPRSGGDAHISRDDSARLEAALPATRALLDAIDAAAQGRVFSAAELVAHAGVDARLADALRGMSAKRVGKRLRAIAGRVCGGIVLQRVGREAGGTLWAVVQVADDHLHAPAGDSIETGA